MSTRRKLYPPVKPYASGRLEVEDGHELYWERVGTPGATPAVFLHGGPGGGCTPAHRRLFDPQRYDVLLFDQRGCGRSTPHACLEANTTWHLVADIERLRTFIGVERWVVCGGSWGSTLALAYAERHPQQVRALVLRGIYLLTQADLKWYYQSGASEIFPDKWQGFLAPIPESERDDLMAAYHRRLTGEDEALREQCAVAWSRWESETSTLLPDPEMAAHFTEPRFALAFARIENHYFTNLAWLEPNQLLEQAHRLAGIPGLIVHGRYDMPCPARNAFALHQAWPDAAFHLIEDAGHAWTEPGILDQLLCALDQFSASD